MLTTQTPAHLTSAHASILAYVAANTRTSMRIRHCIAGGMSSDEPGFQSALRAIDELAASGHLVIDEQLVSLA